MAKNNNQKTRMTLYRLKKLTSFDESIQDKYLLLERTTRQTVNIAGYQALFIYGKTSGKELSWNDTIFNISGQRVPYKNTTVSAAIIIADKKKIRSKAGKNKKFRAWAITFGGGFRFLNYEKVDIGFGQRVVIRCAEPDSLSSINKTTLDERPRAERSTIASGAPLMNFHFEFMGDLATRVVAKGRIDNLSSDDKTVSIQGADSLKLPLSKTPRGLIKDIKTIKKVLSKEPVTEDFKLLEQLTQVKNKQKIAELDMDLVKAIDGRNLLSLTYPHELIDEYGSAQAFKIFGDGRQKVHDFLPTLDHLLEPIEKIKDIDKEVECFSRLQKINKMYVMLYEDSEGKNPCSTRISLKKWLNFQVDNDGKRYFLHNGRWYLIEKDYSAELKKRTEEIFSKGPYFENIPEWKLASHPNDEKKQKKENSEEEYNKILAKSIDGLCLDRELIYTNTYRYGIEACDILAKDGTFVHVKHIASSAPASHLIAQALVSTEILAHDLEAHTKLKEIVEKQGGDLAEYECRPRRIVLVIAKDKLITADSLFAFTQVNLVRHVNMLASQNVEVYVAPIARK
ncbi:MAG: TIGR04141 family sporadically distributed protein [Micrococcaceae bacterium]